VDGERSPERQRLVDLALERSSVGVTIADAEGRIVYVNPADAAMHGYTPEELLGQPSQIFGVAGASGAPPATPVCWRREGLNRTKDGRVFPVRLVSDALLDEDGHAKATVTLCEDISEMRAVQAQLAMREADYRQLVDGASDLIESVGPDGRFRFVNPAWLETLGYRREELDALTVWDVIHPAHHEAGRAALERILSTGRPERIETVFRTQGGAEIEVEGSVAARREAGEVVATLGIFRDLSERRRVERLRQEFLSTVSHELRTPLTSILGAVGLLRGNGLKKHPERAAELLAVAERNGDRLLRLINDLLDLQRLESGELRVEPSPVLLGAVLEEAVHGIQGFADLSGVQVRTTTSAAMRPLVTDRHRLAQVLYNLLSNAIKFSNAGDEVVLTARELGDEVELVVRDRGPGIPDEFKERVFEKFSQADASPARRRGGSGLGLSISKRLIETLGGSIAIQSTPGSGTAVTIRLPRRVS
jgi:PAS domain S-box-containing protein